MEELADKIGEYCNLLEDAIAENDWSVVEDVVEKLNLLYEELDKSCFGDFDAY
jgi:hypothetical protein